METFMTVMKYLWGPLIGAVIGYITNYIAVKMLFHPYKPVMLGKFRLPFTPGIVPLRQKALSLAIGDAVGNHLFTGEDLKELFLSEDSKEKIVDMAMDALDISLAFRENNADMPTTNQLIRTYLKNEQAEGAKAGITCFLTDRIIESLSHMNLGNIIVEQGAAVLLDKKGDKGDKKSAGLGMLSMFINEHTIQAFAPSLSEKLNAYIAENGRDLVYDAVATQLEQYADRPLHDLMAYTSEAQIRSVIGAVYQKLIMSMGDRFSEILDIPTAVEKKVAAMSVKEVEALCMRVMKKELQTIVNLGALIGFVLGLFNMISM